MTICLEPYHNDGQVTLYAGDVRDVLRQLPEASVNCVVTSPPYWSLRDYGVDGQLGLEPTPELFVAHMVEVFREVRRVLRPDGALWLNIGDSYAGSGRGGNPTAESSTLEGSLASQEASRPARTRGSKLPAGFHESVRLAGGIGRAWVPPPAALKPKDLVGIPWRLAFALQADGWWLRQDIIWSKPNPMPESVRDRCTKAHEYLFLLSKSEGPNIWRAKDTREWSYAPDLKERVVIDGKDARRWRGFDYYYDADAIQEPAGGWNGSEFHDGKNAAVHPDVGMRRSGNKDRKPASARGVPVDTGGKSNGAVAGSVPRVGDSRNKRSVWHIPTAPYPEAHFATFPEKLVEPCILAGCPEGGVVLDPFVGSGTTLAVAKRLGRRAVGIDLNEEYLEMAKRRCSQMGLFLPGIGGSANVNPAPA